MHRCDLRQPRTSVSPTTVPSRSITVFHRTPSHFAINQKGHVTTICSKLNVSSPMRASPVSLGLTALGYRALHRRCTDHRTPFGSVTSGMWFLCSSRPGLAPLWAPSGSVVPPVPTLLADRQGFAAAELSRHDLTTVLTTTMTTVTVPHMAGATFMTATPRRLLNSADVSLLSAARQRAMHGAHAGSPSVARRH